MCMHSSNWSPSNKCNWKDPTLSLRVGSFFIDLGTWQINDGAVDLMEILVELILTCCWFGFNKIMLELV